MLFRGDGGGADARAVRVHPISGGIPCDPRPPPAAGASVPDSHDYKRARSYTVTVTAMDAAGNQVSGKGTLKLDEVPHACAHIKAVLTANLSRTGGKSCTRVQIYGCTLIAICSDALGDTKFTW